MRREVPLNAGGKHKESEVRDVGRILQIASAPIVEPLESALAKSAMGRPRRAFFDSRNESIQAPAKCTSHLEHNVAINGKKHGSCGHVRPEEMPCEPVVPLEVRIQ